MNIIIKLRLLYVKKLLKVYSCSKDILPKFSNKLKRHIEKVSLKNSNLIYNKISKNG